MKNRLRWIGEARESGSVEVETSAVERMGGGFTCTNDLNDTYFVGSGFQIYVQDTRTVKWRVRMTRDDTTNPIDACGFALLDSTRSQILLSYHWNSDGDEYEGDQYRTPWMREHRVHDDNDDKDIFGTDATLQITVCHTWYQDRPGDYADQVKNTLSIYGFLHLVESDGSLTSLDWFHEDFSPHVYPDQTYDFFRRCGLYPRWDTEEVCDLCVVPFVRLVGKSTATLSRVPAGPDEQ